MTRQTKIALGVQLAAQITMGLTAVILNWHPAYMMLAIFTAGTGAYHTTHVILDARQDRRDRERETENYRNLG